jgi:hypothetical protein
MGMKANVLGVMYQRNRWLLRPHSRRFLMAKMRLGHLVVYQDNQRNGAK